MKSNWIAVLISATAGLSAVVSVLFGDTAWAHAFILSTVLVMYIPIIYILWKKRPSYRKWMGFGATSVLSGDILLRNAMKGRDDLGTILWALAFVAWLVPTVLSIRAKQPAMPEARSQAASHCAIAP